MKKVSQTNQTGAGQTTLQASSPRTEVSSPQTETSHLRTFAPIFVILAAIFWGILVVFVRAFGQAEFKAMEIVTLRVYSSAIFSWIFLMIFGQISQRSATSKAKANTTPTAQTTRKTTSTTTRKTTTTTTRKTTTTQTATTKTTPPQARPRTFHLRDSWCFIGTGLVSIVFFSYCYFWNVEVSSAAVAAILMYTSPIFVTLLSVIFFKEKITKAKLVALVLAIIGCALVSGIAGGIGSTTPLGIALGLGSGIGYALYSIFGRFALDKGYSPFMVTAMTFTFACVGVLPFIDIARLATRLVNEPKYILLALLMGLIGSCTPFALYTVGLRYMEASKAAILATLEPIVTALVGTFLYKEPIDLFIITGIAMVLVAGILCSRSSK